MKKWLSVVIPVYNVEDYLAQCIESVVKQTSDDMEVILIDDGSTDFSKDICADFAKRYSQLRYIRQDNAGLGAARNRGLEKAEGHYAVFLDSDDYWADNTAASLREVLERNPDLDIVYFDAEMLYEDKALKKQEKTDERMYNRKGKVCERNYGGIEFFKEVYPLYFNVSACMAVFRREILLKNGLDFPEGILHEDILFSLRSVLAADKVRYLAKQLYVRRYRAGSIVTKPVEQKRLADSATVLEMVCGFIHQWDCQKDKTLRCRLSEFVYWQMSDFMVLCGQGEKRICLEALEKAFIVCLNFYNRICYNEQLDNMGECRDALGIMFELLFRLSEFSFSEEKTEQILSESFDRNGCKGMPEVTEELRGRYRALFERQVRRLRIGNNNREPVGIYGGGGHTANLLKAFESFGFRIQNGYIIESETPDEGKTVYGFPVISVKDSPRYVKTILISSFLYEKDMYKTAQEYAADGVEIYRLYEDSFRPIAFEQLVNP